MTLFGFLILLLIAAICGGIGQAISGYSFGGCLVSSGVGFIGAILGMWMANGVGLPVIWAVNIEGNSFPVVWSVIGAAVFTGILGLIVRKRRVV